MSDTTAPVVESSQKTGELRVERPKQNVDAAVESGDVSGVYRIARAEADSSVTRELEISKIDQVDASIAGPEIIALKQADAELQNKTESALGGLRATLDGLNKTENPQPQKETEAEKDARLEAVALEAMKSGPLTVEEMAKDLEAHEAATAIPLVTKKEEPILTIEELKPEEQKEVEQIAAEAQLDEDIARGVTELEKGLERIDTELQAERQALADFESTHGTAHTPLEEAYLGALHGRIDALEYERKAHEMSDDSFESKAKLAELKRKAEKAEQAYQQMYNAQMAAPVEISAAPSEEKKLELHLDEEDEDYEAQQYAAFHGGVSPVSRDVAPKAKAEYQPAPESPMQQPQKPRGRMGKLIDSLKFWRYPTGKQQ